MVIAPGALVKIRKGLTRKRLETPPAKQNARGRIWQSMRMSPRFTSPELQATAEANAANVGAMIRALLACGYVRCMYASSGEVGDHSVYTLIRNTGPHAPRLRGSLGIYDLNLKQEVARNA